MFRTADGRVVNSNGEELPPEIAAGVIWPDYAPSAEEYFAARAERDAAIAKLNEWQSYRSDVLGDIRHRFDDEDNPMSKEDLREALDTIDDMRPELSSLAAPDFAETRTPAADVSALNMPLTLN